MDDKENDGGIDLAELDHPAKEATPEDQAREDARGQPSEASAIVPEPARVQGKLAPGVVYVDADNRTWMGDADGRPVLQEHKPHTDAHPEPAKPDERKKYVIWVEGEAKIMLMAENATDAIEEWIKTLGVGTIEDAASVLACRVDEISAIQNRGRAVRPARAAPEGH